MPRLFTGLALPDAVRADLARGRGGLVGARWIEPEDFHVTLRFAGDVGRDVAEEWAEALAGVRRHAFTICLDRLEVFGGAKPRALVARVVPNAALSDLQAEHERLARRVGLPAETRKYAPHVTLARLRGVSPSAMADHLGTLGLFRAVSFEVDGFVLFSARASSGGGPYVAEADYPLLR